MQWFDDDAGAEVALEIWLARKRSEAMRSNPEWSVRLLETLVEFCLGAWISSSTEVRPGLSIRRSLCDLT